MGEDRNMIAVDGNRAEATIAHRLSEIIAVYPITPYSPVGEDADKWSANEHANL